MCVEIDPKDIKVSDGTVEMWKLVLKDGDSYTTFYETNGFKIREEEFSQKWNIIDHFIHRHGYCGFPNLKTAKKYKAAIIKFWTEEDQWVGDIPLLTIRKYRVCKDAEYAKGIIPTNPDFGYIGAGLPAMRAERLVPCE